MTNKYKMTNIGLALEYLLKNLQDDDNRKVFDNVILGLSEKDVKQFNNCIGIAYVKGANEFKNSFGTRNVPEKVNTVVAFVVHNYIVGTSVDKLSEIRYYMPLSFFPPYPGRWLRSVMRLKHCYYIR